MSSSEQDNTWSSIHNRETTVGQLTTSRSSNTVSSARLYTNHTSKPEWSTTHIIPPPPAPPHHAPSPAPHHSFDSESSPLFPSYMDILNSSGQDWLAAYDQSVSAAAAATTTTATTPAKPLKSKRRTFYYQNTNPEKQPVTLRKTKSLRGNTSRTKLKSPPPPLALHPPPPSPLLATADEKKQSMRFVNKSKRKLSAGKDNKKGGGGGPSLADDPFCLPVLTREPRRTVSSSLATKTSCAPKLPPSTSMSTNNNGLSEYQGYTRPSRNRSFTYSPPPRTSHLHATQVPAVPPIPKLEGLKPKTTTRKISVKKSRGDSPPSSGSGVGASSSADQHVVDSHLATSPIPTLTPIEKSIILTPSTSAYALSLSMDLAEIEKDIRELEIQRDQHSYFINNSNGQKPPPPPPLPKIHTRELSYSNSQQNVATTKAIGRKRGKTLPGSLATPPPIPTVPLPPMTLNPIHMTIPTNLQQKAAITPLYRLQQSTSSTTTAAYTKSNKTIKSSPEDYFVKKQQLVGRGFDIKRLESEPSLSTILPKRKSHTPTSSIADYTLPSSTKARRAASCRQPSSSRQAVSSGQQPLPPPPRPTPKIHVSQPSLLHQQRQQQKQQQQQQQQHNHHHRHPTNNTSCPPPPPPPAVAEGARSPKSIYTALKYYGQYLSDYEKQIEIHDFSQIYFVGPHAQTKHTPGDYNFGFDDERGDYKIVMQDHLAYRYEVMDVLGRGSFGQVVKCFDHKTAHVVAIKLIRNKKRFHAQALTEVNILQKLVEWDPHDQCHTIRMTGHFYFRQHLCIAFECLSMNLYDFIKSNHFQGFSLNLIKRMTFQILQSLTMLAQHNVIHCDLKPENIMLKHPAKSTIKVIDFGSSCFESERIYTYIQSRFYRSPEVILGISYHKAIDMWSVGCIIAELYTGQPLFPGETEQEQLSCIMETMGLPDQHLIDNCSRRKLFFDSMGNPRIVANSKGKKRYPGTRSLFQALKCHDAVFVDFVERCLQWDPSKRLTPQQGSRHAWIMPPS